MQSTNSFFHWGHLETQATSSHNNSDHQDVGGGYHNYGGGLFTVSGLREESFGFELEANVPRGGAVIALLFLCRRVIRERQYYYYYNYIPS